MDQTFYIGDTPVEECLARVADEADLSAWDSLLAEAMREPLEGWPVGLEQALLARRLPRLHPAPIALRHPVARNARFGDSGSFAHLLARPPSELAAWKLWEMLDAGPLASCDLPELAKLLGGDPRLRSREVATTPRPSGERFEFLKPELVPERLDRLLRRLAEPTPSLPPLLHALAIYFETLCIHPLPDGNGRLARLLFLGTLRRTGRLSAPLCPLGPAMALNRGHVLAAYLAWELDRDPRPLAKFVAEAMPATLRCAQELVRNSSAPRR